MTWGPWRRVYPTSWLILDIERWSTRGDHERRTASGQPIGGAVSR